MCRARNEANPRPVFGLGVGHGHLYQLFVERGWKCTGVDPGDWAGRFPNVHRNLSEVDSTLTADLLAAFDVLEHVSDPVSNLVFSGNLPLRKRNSTVRCLIGDR